MSIKAAAFPRHRGSTAQSNQPRAGFPPDGGPVELRLAAGTTVALPVTPCGCWSRFSKSLHA
jgi:hypothetical protein